MRILIAAVLFVLSIPLLGFINLATYEAITQWGVEEAIAEIFGTSHNIAVFAGCWTVGLAFVWLGAGCAALVFGFASGQWQLVSGGFLASVYGLLWIRVVVRSRLLRS